jgi:serine protease Do
VFRAGLEETISVTVDELSRANAQAKADQHRTLAKQTVLGLTLVPARAVAGAGDTGVVVVHVSPSNNAAEADCRPATSSWMSIAAPSMIPPKSAEW